MKVHLFSRQNESVHLFSRQNESVHLFSRQNYYVISILFLNVEDIDDHGALAYFLHQGQELRTDGHKPRKD